MRQLATGQLRSDQATDDRSNTKIGADTNKSLNKNTVKIGADTKLKAVPKSTLAVYAAALMRFYRWCSVERLVLMSADEFERLAIRLRELRGRQKRTIIDKVPADEVIEALLKQARVNLVALVEQHSELQTNGDLSISEDSVMLSRNATANLTQPKTALAKYDALHHRLQALRNLALVETLKATGARVSEITGLTRGNLDAVNRRARVVGKGNKERWVYFSTPAWDTVQSYLQTRTRLLAQAGHDDQMDNETTRLANTEPQKFRKKTVRLKSAEIAQQPVFARHDRGAGVKQVKPLTPRSVQKILWELVEAVEDEDLPMYITPHKFRHWFATKMLAATGDLAVTQDLLGHANPATTRIYAQVSETRKQNSPPAFRAPLLIT